MEEKKDADEPKMVANHFGRIGALIYGLAMILNGIILLGCMFPLFLELETYLDVRQPLQEIGSPLAVELILPMTLIMSFLLFIIAGFLSLVAFAVRIRIIGYCSMALTLVASIQAIVVAAIVTASLDTLLLELEGNPVSNDFDEKSINIMDYTSAIYNECCFPVYDSENYNFNGFQETLLQDGDPLIINQQPVIECGVDIEASCPTEIDPPMFPQLVIDILSILSDSEDEEEEGLINTLCHCITNVDDVEIMTQVIQDNDTCEKLRNAVVEDTNTREIPVVGFEYGQIPAALILQGLPEIAEQANTIDRFAIVGKMLSPGSAFGEPAEDIGFSCGLGYAKSLALTTYFYVEDTLNSTLIGGFVTGSLGLISTLIVLLYWTLGSYCVSDVNEDEYGVEDEYGAAEDVQTAAAVKSAKPAKTKSKKKAATDEYDEYSY